MSIIFHCDRCDTKLKRTVETALPEGWAKVLAYDLCKTCMLALHDFLRHVPAEKQATGIPITGDR